MNSLDQEMVRSCLQGNEAAWADFVRSYKRRIYSMSYRFTRCRAEAEDLTQDVFVRAYQTLNSYRAETGSVSGWLMRVARNLLIDRYRKTRRNVRVDSIRETEFSVHDPRTPSPLQCLARDETAVMVHHALQKLSTDNRNVILLHELEGLTLYEVAAILHVPVGTVKSRMMRGRRELARILRTPANRRNRPGVRPTGKWHALLSSGVPPSPAIGTAYGV